MERIWLDEEAVLKTVGCKRFGGSSPSFSAKSFKMESNSKFFMLESQIMFQIKELEEKMEYNQEEYDKGNLTEKHYKFNLTRYKGAQDYLMIMLTIYDNPLSNFIAQERKGKTWKERNSMKLGNQSLKLQKS